MKMKPILLAAVGLALATTAAAQPLSDRERKNTCFGPGSNVVYRPADENTIYVRDGSSFFRISVDHCTNLTSIDPVIVNVLHGSDRVCGPLDLQLTIYDGPGPGGFPQPCIAQSIVRMSPDEVAAIPKKFKP